MTEPPAGSSIRCRSGMSRTRVPCPRTVLTMPNELTKGTREAVRVPGIFGANASGKSNCPDALTFMRQMAIQSDRAVEPGMHDERVREEWLYHFPLGRRRRVFERDGDDFSWGEESGRHTELEQIAGITAPTALFLSTVAGPAPGVPELA